MNVNYEYVFRVFRLFWTDMIGSDHPIHLEDRIDEWLKTEGLFDDIDFSDVLFRIEKDLGVQISLAEFSEHFHTGCESVKVWKRDYARHFTFGRFAELIAGKNPDSARFDRALTPVSFTPALIAGQTCASAGAFLGIQQLAANIEPQTERFAPSSRIAGFLKGRSRNRFWRSLRVQTGGSVPPLIPCSQRWWVRLAFILWFIAVPMIVGVIVEQFGEPPAPMLTVSFLIHGATILIAALLVDDSFGGFIPKRFQTFTDLAHHIATHTTPLTTDD